MHVGFVGTGNMGGPMATNVLKAGHQLTIFDARAEATAPLEKLGARRAPDLPTVAAAVEVTLTSLPNDAIVEEVLFGSAGTPGLVAGTLAVMVGAPAHDVAPYESVLRAIGKSFFFLGETGRGNILKLLNNFVALTNQAALCEALALADRLGVDRQTVGEVLSRASGASFILERKLSALVAHDYLAGFFVDLICKDLR